jgi:hypothetical protein
MSFIVCVALCAVYCLSVVCFLCDVYFYVLYLIVVILPPVKNPFAVKLNKDNNLCLLFSFSDLRFKK